MLFASFRVAQYSHRSSSRIPEKESLIRSIENAVTPEYTVSYSKEEQDNFHRQAGRAARLALLEVPSQYRPSDHQAVLLAETFASYLTLYWAGSVDEAITTYSSRDLSLPRPLADENAANRDQSWSMATAWARHRPIDFDKIKADCRYHEGQLVSIGQGGEISTARSPRSGARLNGSGHHHTVYDLIIPVVAPNVDGRSEHAVDIHISFIEDFPGGGWDIYMTSARGLPAGKLVILPIP